MLPFLKPALNLFKKISLVVIVYFVVISLFSYFIGRDKVSLSSSSKTNPILENRKEIYKVINDKELNKTQQGKITIAVYRGMMCSMMGEGCTNNPSDGDKNFGKSGLGFISNLITMPFINPPASGVAWTYSGLSNARFFPKALAAEGIGMGSIQPFAKIWKIFRDVAYLLLVIVLIAIGFMVMFRAKINPQTVISVENALPKIIIALILITFSFAIAGFMIDLMYLLIALIVSVLGPSSNYGYWGPINDTVELQKHFIQADPGIIYEGIGHNFGDSIWRLPNAILGLIPKLGLYIKIIGGAIITFIGQRVINTIVLVIAGMGGIADILKSIEGQGQPVGLGATLKLEQLLAGISTPWELTLLMVIIGLIMFVLVPVLLGVLIWFSIVFIFFKIILIIFSSYIKILINIVLSPFYLLLEAVPGQSAFTNWLKNLAGELIVFPLIVGIFLLGSVIVDSASSGNLVQFPFLVGIDPKSFGFVLGIMILYMIPDFIKAARSIFIPKPGLFDQIGPGVLFGGAGAAVGGAMGGMGQIGSISLFLSGIGRSDMLQGLAKKFGLGPPKPGPQTDVSGKPQ